MKKITTFKQIKKIIAPIPADKFCTNVYENNQGQCCFLGHIHRSIDTGHYAAYGDGQGYGARELTREFIRAVHNVEASGVSVNNENNINGYTEPIIKDRLMHMIEDGIVWEEALKNAQ